jgi:hypothetical protein
VLIKKGLAGTMEENQQVLIQKIVDFMKMVQERPYMYASPTREAPHEPVLVHFLNGFQSACWAAGISFPSRELITEIAAKRGWSDNAMGPWKDMANRGLSEQEIIDEVMIIQIEAWKSVLDEG